MTRRSTPSLLVAGVLLVGALGGCSSASDPGGTASPAPQQTAEATPNNVQSLPAEEILEKAKAAAGSASSVTVKAATEQEGQSVNFDLTVTNNGAQGTFETSSDGSLQLVTTPDTVYVKGDDNFNTNFGGEAGAKLLAGKWLSIPADDPQAASFSGFGDVQSLMGNILQTDATSFTKEGNKDIEGVPCIGVKGDKGTLWVATVGEPFPMSVTAPEGEQGSLTMTGWNAPVTITPPPAEEVVDVSKLGTESPAPSPTSS